MVGVPISTAPHIYVPWMEVWEGPQEDPFLEGSLGDPPTPTPGGEVPGGGAEIREFPRAEFPGFPDFPAGGNSGKSVHTPGTPSWEIWHPPKSSKMGPVVGELDFGPNSDPPGGVQKPPRALAGLSPTFRIKKWSIRGGPPPGRDPGIPRR